MDDDQTATIRYYTTGAYDGPGWYWLDAESPEEGGVGARDCGYVAFNVVAKP